MQNWEYVTINRDIDLTVAAMNKLGEQGWELVAVTDFEGIPWRAFFKRPKQYPPPATGSVAQGTR